MAETHPEPKSSYIESICSAMKKFSVTDAVLQSIVTPENGSPAYIALQKLPDIRSKDDAFEKYLQTINTFTDPKVQNYPYWNQLVNAIYTSPEHRERFLVSLILSASLRKFYSIEGPVVRVDDKDKPCFSFSYVVETNITNRYEQIDLSNNGGYRPEALTLLLLLGKDNATRISSADLEDAIAYYAVAQGNNVVNEYLFKRASFEPAEVPLFQQLLGSDEVPSVRVAAIVNYVAAVTTYQNDVMPQNQATQRSPAMETAEEDIKIAFKEVEKTYPASQIMKSNRL